MLRVNRSVTRGEESKSYEIIKSQFTAVFVFSLWPKIEALGFFVLAYKKKITRIDEWNITLGVDLLPQRSVPNGGCPWTDPVAMISNNTNAIKSQAFSMLGSFR